MNVVFDQCKLYPLQQYFDSTTVKNAPSNVTFSQVGRNSQLPDYCPSQQVTVFKFYFKLQTCTL